MENELDILVLKAKEKDEKAFNSIYKLYKDKIYALSIMSLKHQQDAENATQQTFMKVYEKLSTLDDVSAFNTWIQRIALNECNQILRKRKHIFSTDDEKGKQIVDGIEDDFMLPQEYAERSDLSKRVIEIINDLPAVQRQTLVLSIYDELSITEISEIMKCSKDTVKSRLRYAKANIKNEIEARERSSGEKFFGFVPVPFSFVFKKAIESKKASSTESARIWYALNQMILSDGSLVMNPVSGATVAARAAIKAGGSSTLHPVKSAMIAGIAGLLLIGTALSGSSFINISSGSSYRDSFLHTFNPYRPREESEAANNIFYDNYTEPVSTSGGYIPKTDIAPGPLNDTVIANPNYSTPVSSGENSNNEGNNVQNSEEGAVKSSNKTTAETQPSTNAGINSSLNNQINSSTSYVTQESQTQRETSPKLENNTESTRTLSILDKIYNDYDYYLKDNKADIERSYNYFDGGNGHVVAFEDLTGDGIPEMIVMMVSDNANNGSNGDTHVHVITSTGTGCKEISLPDGEVRIGPVGNNSYAYPRGGCFFKDRNGQLYLSMTTFDESNNVYETVIEELNYIDGRNTFSKSAFQCRRTNSNFTTPDVTSIIGRDTTVMFSTYDNMDDNGTTYELAYINLKSYLNL